MGSGTIGAPDRVNIPFYLRGRHKIKIEILYLVYILKNQKQWALGYIIIVLIALKIE